MWKRRKGREEQPWARSAFRAHVKKQLPNPTEGPSVREPLDAEHDVLLDSAFRHDTDSRATELPVAYLLEGAEVSLQFSRGEGRHLVV